MKDVCANTTDIIETTFGLNEILLKGHFEYANILRSIWDKKFAER